MQNLSMKLVKLTKKIIADQQLIGKYFCRETLSSLSRDFIKFMIFHWLIGGNYAKKNFYFDDFRHQSLFVFTCVCKIANITLVDADRFWLKSHIWTNGLYAREFSVYMCNLSYNLSLLYNTNAHMQIRYILNSYYDSIDFYFASKLW